ncbi:RelA/SpoT domain-containing protein [Patulibacter sp. NPDC049589]|uniref:RelA/SpoT domain-containing protein n=1 Tax=Patulibacter sp. NPDC049589 TaxID=3154731 RepID=UPI00344411B4
MPAADTDPPSKGAINRAGRRLAAALIPPEDKRAGPETLEFYKHGFRDETDLLDTAATVRAWRADHAYPLRKVSANLRHYVQDSSDTQVTQRLKKFGTVIQKLRRFDRMDLTQMDDIGGCRVVTRDMDDARALFARLGSNWDVRRTRDYVSQPKPDGYRALHLVAVRDARFVEIQIRTPLQDLWANVVERDGRRLGVGLKFGRGNDRVREDYRRMADLLAAEERGEVPAAEDLGALRDRFDPLGGSG